MTVRSGIPLSTILLVCMVLGSRNLGASSLPDLAEVCDFIAEDRAVYSYVKTEHGLLCDDDQKGLRELLDGKQGEFQEILYDWSWTGLSIDLALGMVKDIVDTIDKPIRDATLFCNDPEKFRARINPEAFQSVEKLEVIRDTVNGSTCDFNWVGKPKFLASKSSKPYFQGRQKASINREKTISYNASFLLPEKGHRYVSKNINLVLLFRTEKGVKSVTFTRSSAFVAGFFDKARQEIKAGFAAAAAPVPGAAR